MTTKKEEQILYKEVQSLWWFALFFALLALTILHGGIYQWGQRPIPLGLAIALASLFILIILGFYQLKIVITPQTICASFGVGWLKKRFEIEQLAIEKAEIVKLPLYYGIGYRISAKGVFLNSRPGPALFIPTIDGQDAFFVGTSKSDEIIAILNALTSKNKDKI